MNNEALRKAAAGIKDKKLKANAEALLDSMETAIEGLGDNDTVWRPSALKVVQGTTNTDNLPDGAGVGAMVVGSQLLAKKYNVIPLRVWDSRIAWAPDSENSGEIICSSPDAKVGYKYGECRKCPKSDYIDGVGTACNKNKNVIVVAADLSDVFVCNFSKSQYASGMDWQKTMKQLKVHPFKRIYSLNTDKHPKFSTVKALFAHVQQDEIPDDVLAFLEVLFSRVSEDRANQIDGFYESIRNRAAAALEDKSEGDGFEQAALPEVKEGEVVEGAGDDTQYTM